MTLFGRLLGRDEGPRRPRISLGDAQLAYAIGDVHGRLDLLLQLEAMIAADAASRGLAPTVIYLGDYVDRGPQSAQVIDHLIGKVRDVRNVALVGNHEIMMQRFCSTPSKTDIWLGNGGYETLVSYAGDRDTVDRAIKDNRHLAALVKATVPSAHTDFLAALPVMAELGNFIFVHAGFQAGIDPDQHSDDQLTLQRGPQRIPGKTVVHGHTPVAVPVFSSAEINIDTGAFATGRLSAIRITDQREVTLL